MATPRFSIVIPTRQRHDTLRHTLRTCLDQQYDDYEIIVCDNFSSPETREVVEAAKSNNISYLRTSTPLAMTANWELAVSRARGEYVTVLGDDDGLMPYALAELDSLANQHQARAITWERGMYTWPNYPIAEDINVLRFPIVRHCEWRDAPRQIMKVAEFKANYDTLPMIYNSVIHRDLIGELRAKTQRVFSSPIPDVYSGFAFGFLAQQFLHVSVPMNIAGLSGHSNGVAVLVLNKESQVAQEFYQLNQDQAILPPKWVPDVPNNPAAIADGFLSAKEALFPQNTWLVMDRRQMIDEIAKAILITNPEQRAAARQKIRDTLHDEPVLLAWFDSQPDPPPAQRWSPRPPAYGNDGRYLNLYADRLGITNIAEAVQCAANLLCLRGGQIQYNLPSLGEPRPSAPIAVETPAKKPTYQRITREVHRLIDQGTRLLNWSTRRAG